MYCGIVFEVVCGDFGVVCGSLRWFAVFQWTGSQGYHKLFHHQVVKALKEVDVNS